MDVGNEILALIGVLGLILTFLINFIIFSDKTLPRLKKITSFLAKWWSGFTANNLDYGNLDEDSPLKQEFNKIFTALDELKINDEIMNEKLDNADNERLENKAKLLSIEILNGIDHDIGAEAVLKLDHQYKSLPPDREGNERNGYVQWKVDSYLKQKDQLGMTGYFNHVNNYELNKFKEK